MASPGGDSKTLMQQIVRQNQQMVEQNARLMVLLERFGIQEAFDFVTYAGTVNKYCEDFELNKLTADQFKSLIFICGLRSSKDTDIRTRLLSKLEMNADDECKLESLIAECQR